MKFETTQNNALAKLPMLKLGEYEMWKIKIKQYLQIQDYALWEVIENGNSWVPVPVTTQEGGTSTKIIVPATAEEKACKKNDVKARSLLLMSLPNEHQLTFSQYNDAQSMFVAIKARFGGNEATKKTQKALLKQQYENFNASSSESLDSIFNRLQKLVSRLAILGVATSPEDLNLKFLRSLPAEWDTHVVVWMNKPDFETMGLDDLYNNFKIVEQKVKKSAGASNGDKNLAFVTTSGPSSTNNINTSTSEVSTASTKVNTASTEITTATFSDATVYAFLSSQPKGSQLVHEDLEQLHDGDLEEIDLKWNMALLSMRARRFYQRTGRKITIDESTTARYDKSKVECFNCHKLGHFARECRSPRSRSNDQGSKTQEPTRKPMIIEDTSEKAMMAIDGIGFDWSEMAEEQVQTNMALMAFSDSEVYTDKTCSKSCLKNLESLKKQGDDLLVKLNDSQFKTATYKRGLATLEEQIVTYKKNEVLFFEEVAILKREVGCKEYELGILRSELEKVKKEKDGIDFKIKGFNKSAKDLDEVLESQRFDKNKQGLGYNVVALPHPLTYNRPTKLDLSYSGLEEFKEPEVNMYGPRENVPKPTNNYDKESDNSEENSDDSLEKQQVSDSESSSIKSPLKFDKDWKEKFFHPDGKVETFKPKHSEKPVKRTVRYAEMYRSQRPRGNQRNWNGLKSNQLGNEFVMQNKACFECGSFDHMKLNCPYQQKEREVTRNNYNRVDYDYYAKSNTHRHMTPRAVLLRNGLKPLNTARPIYTAQPKPTVNCARPMSYFTNQAQTTVKRPFYKKTNRYDNQNFNTVRPRAVNTARPFVNIARANGFNAVKPSACWVWRPTKPNGASLGNPQLNDKGHVTFGGGAYGGRISGKGTLKTDSLDFDDFPDENQILLRIPREDNMYSFNMRNIVPKESLTCLATKATLDESMLWQRRLSHINFKNINKLLNKILCDNETEFKNSVMDDFCKEKCIRREYSVARTPQQNGVAERRNRTLIEAARTMLADSKLPTTFWAEAVSTAYYVQNRVLIVKPHNKTPYELFRGFKPAISFMKPFGCHVTILNTLDHLGKFDGKSDEGFLVGYSLSSKALGVYNTRTRKIQALMTLQKDATYFDSTSKHVSNNDPKPVTPAQEHGEDGPNDENDDQDKSVPDSSPKEVNTADSQVNTASPGVNTGSFNLNTAGSPINTAASKDKSRASPSSEATHLEYFNDEDEPEVTLGNILSSYTVPTTPHTRVHINHPLSN
ncbi:ribonuclease H-like domain-containing protein [Tanacetum coccineum]